MADKTTQINTRLPIRLVIDVKKQLAELRMSFTKLLIELLTQWLEEQNNV